MLVKCFKETKTTKETKNKILKKIGEPASMLTKGGPGKFAERHNGPRKNDRGG